MSPFLLVAAISPLFSSAAQTAESPVQLCQKAAEAIGAYPTQAVWCLRGIAQEKSLWQTFTMTGDAKYRFRMAVTGPLTDVEAFDGKTSWELGHSGVPHATAHAPRDISRMVAYVIEGLWASPSAPLTFKPVEGDALSLEIRCSDGDTPATLTLDPQTYLPSKMTYWGADGQDVWTFAGYTREGGWAVPTRVDHKGGDQNERFVIDSVIREAKDVPGFGMAKVDEEGVHYDREAPKQIEFKRAGGWIFVHPLLNGKDEGWFFLDTGADVMVIDSKLADKLGAETIGSDSAAGVVATTEMKVRRGVKFQLGPITLDHPSYFQMDIASMSAIAGVPVAGVCGYDFISRGALDIDLATHRINIYEPGAAPLPSGAKWVPFTFCSNVPCVECGFAPDHKGLFNVDTGSMSAVDFCSPTVDKYRMLDGRQVVTSMTGGAGGTAESKAGKIEWLEFAGVRFEQVNAGFQVTKKGVFASPFFDGNIGEGLLRNGRLVLDYRNSRLAFVRGK